MDSLYNTRQENGFDEYKITNYRKANGIKVYTLWKNDKIIASSSDYNKITEYKLKNKIK